MTTGGRRNPRRGAAMTYALMFFLMCALVGSMVVTAASANAGKAAKMREEQQEYLAVRSAARMVAEMMSRGSFGGYFTAEDEIIRQAVLVGGYAQTVITHKIQFLGGPDPSDPAHAPRVGYTTDIACFSPELRTAIGNLYLQNASYDGVALLSKLDGVDVSGDIRYQVPAEIKSTFQVDVDGMPPVTVTLEISKGGNGKLPMFSASITAVSASGNYKLELEGLARELKGRTAVQIAPSVTQFRRTTDIYWDSWEARKEVA